MKILKKILLMYFILIMVSSAFISCGFRITPEESTRAYLNVLLKEDKTNISKIGMNEEEYTKLKNDEKNDIINLFLPSGVVNIATDEDKNSFIEKLYKGFSKIDYEVTVESADKDTAKVNVKLKPFDISKITNESQNKIKEKYLANPAITQKEILQENLKIVGELFLEGVVKDEDKIVPITLTKKGNVWKMDDNAKSDILNAIFGK